MSKVRPICPMGRGKFKLDPENISVDMKVWLATMVNNSWQTPKYLASEYEIKIDLVRSFARRAKKGLSNSNKRGRSARLTPDMLKVLKAKVDTGPFKMKETEVKTVVDVMLSEAHEANDDAKSTFKPLSKRSLIRTQKKINCFVGNAELGTDAMSDVRNWTSFAVMNILMVNIVRVFVGLILNMDATQFTVGYEW